jgi:2'-5' RNA ligase
MRLFIGIELSDDLARRAARAADRLRTTIERAARRAVVRWVPSANLHITIWFLGEVPDARIERVSRVLAKPFTAPAFTLRLGGAGTFPPSGEPRAVWLGLVEGRDSLLAIHGELTTRLAALEFSPEKRAYSPHLTIGRVKEISRRDAAAIRAVISSAPKEIGACVIKAVTLFRSRTSPHGSQYEALLRVPLE